MDQGARSRVDKETRCSLHEAKSNRRPGGLRQCRRELCGSKVDTNLVRLPHPDLDDFSVHKHEHPIVAARPTSSLEVKPTALI